MFGPNIIVLSSYPMPNANILISGKVIGCAKGCGASAFETPYDDGVVNPEPKVPTHGQAPSNVPENQKSEFTDTCGTSKTSYNFESQQQSFESASNGRILGDTAGSTEPSTPETEPSENTQPGQTLGSVQPRPPPPSQDSFQLSNVPEPEVSPNTESTSETTEPNYLEIFQRSVRKSPRDFRIGSG